MPRRRCTRLPALAAELGVGAVHIKDEGFRLGLGSFKALGGAYAVTRLVLEEAARQRGRAFDIADLQTPEVRAVASRMTFACATDGNHGRSVAQGAQLVGATSVVFVHAGVSDARVAAIARFGAQMIRVAGTYDDSVIEAARVSAEKGWTVVSDTSWPGYERIPGLVMQGYTALVREALRQIGEAPTHVFVQAGVGGVAAAVAGHLAIVLGDKRPTFVVVDPARAACIYETAKAGHPVKIAHGAADRDGDARMLRALAARLARAVARGGRLHDGRGRRGGRGDEPPRAPGRRRSAHRRRRERRRRAWRARSARRAMRTCARSLA